MLPTDLAGGGGPSNLGKVGDACAYSRVVCIIFSLICFGASFGRRGSIGSESKCYLR